MRESGSGGVPVACPPRYPPGMSEAEVIDSDYWARYYEVTAERPAWETVRKAVDLFAADDAAAGAGSGSAKAGPRLAVDLGSGAGRDVRQLLRAGWRVIAVDGEPGSKAAMDAHVEPGLRDRLEIVTADIASFEIPRCDLVNASVSLQFLSAGDYAAVWRRMVAALAPGGRISAMIYGDHDQSAGEPGFTVIPVDRLKRDLDGFEIESWLEREEETQLALGDPHHIHMFEFVARRR